MGMEHKLMHSLYKYLIRNFIWSCLDSTAPSLLQKIKPRTSASLTQAQAIFKFTNWLVWFLFVGIVLRFWVEITLEVYFQTRQGTKYFDFESAVINQIKYYFKYKPERITKEERGRFLQQKYWSNFKKRKKSSCLLPIRHRHQQMIVIVTKGLKIVRQRLWERRRCQLRPREFRKN